MPTITSWKDLREAIGKLNPEGERGFEGLAAKLFEAETGTCFYVARKGDQPIGDAYSPRSAIALQAKLYNVAALSENEVEGDIDRILREAPTLDVLVVATTVRKGLAQLAARFESKTDETGLDLMLSVLGDGLTSFAALCVVHWDVVQKFISGLDTQSQTWATTEAFKADTRSALEILQSELRGLATRKFVRDASFRQLALRFRGEGAGARTHNRVVLREGVSRPRIEQQLQNWWGDVNVPIVVLQGEEGMGKTWVAAAFVESLLKADAPVTFWLDSLAWGNAGGVEQLVGIALAEVFVADETLRERIRRKIFHQWDRPVLIVLDGANERGAWRAAERVLQDYGNHQDKLRQRVRLLFTSRLLNERPGAGQTFGMDVQWCKLMHSMKPNSALRWPKLHPM